MLNQVILVGRIIEEPIVKEFGNNNQMAVVLVEVERLVNNADKEKTYDVFQIILWKNMMQNYLELCEAGKIIGVKGRLQANNFITKEKNKFYSCDIVAEKISLLNPN
ncbi:Single-stranded DNA-binding protein B [bioreactor metagenome]|uniref:Single-stranded DNA-binding protein B n=1 Tax=bioreactor metagenome TaxID=1076179 RepID=A0A645EA98_9ZZZZ|nr:single-stranded DNA-binding protein [Erysipelotrichaceae bacterium]